MGPIPLASPVKLNEPREVLWDFHRIDLFPATVGANLIILRSKLRTSTLLKCSISELKIYASFLGMSIIEDVI